MVEQIKWYQKLDQMKEDNITGATKKKDHI
jgi:hypothetical protein